MRSPLAVSWVGYWTPNPTEARSSLAHRIFLRSYDVLWMAIDSASKWIATHFLELTMNVVIKSEPLTAIHTDLGAIFVSLELSRSSWLITSLSPGGGEKMLAGGCSSHAG